MLRFWKVTSKNLREILRCLNTFKYLEVICNKFLLKFKLIPTENLFSERIYHKKTRRGQKWPLRVKLG